MTVGQDAGWDFHVHNWRALDEDGKRFVAERLPRLSAAGVLSFSMPPAVVWDKGFDEMLQDLSAPFRVKAKQSVRRRATRAT